MIPISSQADILTALDRIATRIPVKPFPDPEAHSWIAYADAVRAAYTDCVNVARRVLRELPIETIQAGIDLAKTRALEREALRGALNLIAKWGNPDAELELPAMTARACLEKFPESAK